MFDSCNITQRSLQNLSKTSTENTTMLVVIVGVTPQVSQPQREPRSFAKPLQDRVPTDSS